jgi:hypothetical protein
MVWGARMADVRELPDGRIEPTCASQRLVPTKPTRSYPKA